MRGFWIAIATVALALAPEGMAGADEPITSGALPNQSLCEPVDPPVIWTTWVCVAVDDDTNHYPFVEVCARADGHVGPCVRTHDSPFLGVPGACIDSPGSKDAACFFVHRDQNGDGVQDDCRVWIANGGFGWCQQN